jgi:hypothetical protein
MCNNGCNYASDEPVPCSMSDLICGVLICSMDYQEYIDFMENTTKIHPLSWTNIKSFGKELKGQKEFGPAGWEINKWGKLIANKAKKDKSYLVANEFKKFQQYLTDGNVQPPVMVIDNDNAKQSYCHWSVSIVDFLSSKYDMDKAINFPLNQVRLEMAREYEKQGIVEFEDPDTEYIKKYGIPK